MMPSQDAVSSLVEQMGACLKSRGLKLATAESCTGGWIAKLVTDFAGSSDWFEAAVVCYSNAAKTSLLNVPGQTIEEHGAVSGETVLCMTDGLFEKTDADIALSVSGIAGPGGGSKHKPVGTVWLCWGKRGKSSHAHEYHFEGDREAVRLQSVETGVRAVMDLLGCDA